MTVTRIGDGVYRVDNEERAHIVYVAGSARETWAFSEGEVFQVRAEEDSVRLKADITYASPYAATRTATYTAPMPGTVLKVLVDRGARVRKGETVVILEAMKMELPIRALDDGIVAAVHCREGDLVAADAPLVELGASQT